MLFLDDFDGARSELLTAHSAIKMNYLSQQERVLWLLIPLQLAQGIFPSRERTLYRFPRLREAFSPLLRAVRQGNIHAARNCMCQLGMDTQFFVLTRKIELVIFRRLIRRVFEISGKRRIDLFVLKPVFDFSSKDSLSLNVVEEILANLVLNGLVSGYLSYEEQAVMLTGSNPFAKKNIS